MEGTEGTEEGGVQQELVSAGGASMPRPHPTPVAPVGARANAVAATATESAADDLRGGSTAPRRPISPPPDSPQVLSSAAPVPLPASRPLAAGSVTETVSASTEHETGGVNAMRSAASLRAVAAAAAEVEEALRSARRLASHTDGLRDGGGGSGDSGSFSGSGGSGSGGSVSAGTGERAATSGGTHDATRMRGEAIRERREREAAARSRELFRQQDMEALLAGPEDAISDAVRSAARAVTRRETHAATATAEGVGFPSGGDGFGSGSLDAETDTDEVLFGEAFADDGEMVTEATIASLAAVRECSAVPPLGPGSASRDGGGSTSRDGGGCTTSSGSDADAGKGDSFRDGLAGAATVEAGVAAGGEGGCSEGAGLGDAACSSREGLSDSLCSEDREMERLQEEVRKGAPRVFSYLIGVVT